MQRKKFIKNISVFSLALLVTPKSVFSKPKQQWKPGPAPQNEDPNGKTYPYGIIDLHCHPSMKMYLEGKKFYKKHWLRSPGANIFHMQEDVRGLASGNVRGMLAAHYLAERGITREWGSLKLIWPIARTLLFYETDKIEHEDYSNFTQINIMIDDLETQIHITNEKLQKHNNPLRFVIARNYTDFKAACKKENTIAIAHAIEGGHALGRNFPISPDKLKAAPTSEKHMDATSTDPDQDVTDSRLYIQNLLALKTRGVCLMTLAHFFQNDLVWPVEGISPDEKHSQRMTAAYDPVAGDKHLRPVGHDIVNTMFDVGMVVDLTHSTPQARKDVYAILGKRSKEGKTPRPVVFTHVGSRYIFEKYDQKQFDSFKFYDVDDTDIKAIETYGGVMGVIPENFWLTGGDTHLRKYGLKPKDFRDGLGYVVETMIDINSRTDKKQFDNIGIGTDFDGLADNPRDLYKNSQLNMLIAEMQKQKDIFTPDVIKKITWGNADRVLAAGWTNEPALI